MSEEPFNIKLYPLEVFKSDKIQPQDLNSNSVQSIDNLITIKHFDRKVVFYLLEGS